MKIDDNTLIDAYRRLHNIWKVGDEVGLSGQQVHSRLTKIGVINKINLWTEEDDKILLDKYLQYKFENRLDDLANELKRTKQFICRKAKRLGLTDRNNTVMSQKARRKISNNTKRFIKEKGHPKGFLGHSHSDETKKKLSEATKSVWRNPSSIVNSEHFRQLMSDNLHNMKMKGLIHTFSIRGEHRMNINEKDYIFKSTWEVTIALKLQELVENGAICGWDYESTHFDFKDMKRGIRSYCPDFEVELKDHSKLYIEVKGWKMPNSMKRIEMFKERYPNVKYYLIDEEEYGKIISESDYIRRRCI